MPGSRLSLVTRGANPLATYPFPSVKSCDLREVAHDDRRVSSAGSLHPEDVSVIGTTAGMASVAVQFDPERHLSSSPGSGLSTGLQSGSAEFIEWDKRRTRPRFLVAPPSVRDLLLRAKHLFVAARTMGCSHNAASAAGAQQAQGEPKVSR
jgi:hypothetical protein